ncbi:MAG: hypothetical protein ACTSW1_01260 [Candidatus Hodarchaeales archaeon]
MLKMINKFAIIFLILLSVFYIDPFVSSPTRLDNTLSDEIPLLKTSEEYNDTTPEEMSTSYSWISWSEGIDIDEDGFNDTIAINYNMTNFNIVGNINIEFSFEIITDNETYYEGESFYGQVYSVEDVLNYRWVWSVKITSTQNYTVFVTQHTWENYKSYTYGNESFFFENLTRMDLLESYSISTVFDDKDLDGLNDTVNAELRLNFTKEIEHLKLDIRMEIRIWDESASEWIYLKNLYTQYTMTNNNQCVITISYSAIFDGTYNLTFFLSDQYLDDFENFDIQVSLSRFVLISYYQGSLVLLDVDEDGKNDSFKLEYEFNFTISDYVKLWIRVEINGVEDSSSVVNHRYFGQHVTRGTLYDLEYLWHSRQNRSFQVKVSFVDFNLGHNLSFDMYEITLFSYNNVEDSKTFLEEMDLTGNGKTDSVKLHNALKFKAARYEELVLSVSVYKKTNEGWTHTDSLYRNFVGYVTKDQYYDVWAIFPAEEITYYKLVVTVEDLTDGYFYIDGKELFFTPEENYNAIDSWNYDLTFFDLDSDGYEDTVEITVNFQVSYSGKILLNLKGTLTSGGMSFGFYKELDQINLVKGEWYSITLRMSPQKEGDCTLLIQLMAEETECLSFTVDWPNTRPFNAFADYYYTYTELDSDNDGFNDTVLTEFNFKPTIEGKLTLVLISIVTFLNEKTGDWELLPSPPGSQGFFYQSVTVFKHEVSKNEWYSLNSTFALPFNGDFNITTNVQVLMSLKPIFNSYVIQNGHKFNGTSIGFEFIFNDHNESISLGFLSQVNTSSQIDLEVEITILSSNSSDVATINIDTYHYKIFWDTSLNDTLEWQVNLDKTYNFAFFILTVRYMGVIIYSDFYSMPIPSDVRGYYPLEPINLSDYENNTTTTITTNPQVTTSKPNKTPGLTLLIALLSSIFLYTLRKKK